MCLLTGRVHRHTCLGSASRPVPVFMHALITAQPVTSLFIVCLSVCLKPQRPGDCPAASQLVAALAGSTLPSSDSSTRKGLESHSPQSPLRGCQGFGHCAALGPQLPSWQRTSWHSSRALCAHTGQRAGSLPSRPPFLGPLGKRLGTCNRQEEAELTLGALACGPQCPWCGLSALGVWGWGDRCHRAPGSGCAG